MGNSYRCSRSSSHCNIRLQCRSSLLFVANVAFVEFSCFPHHREAAHDPQRMFDMVDQQQAAATLYSSSPAASATHRYELVDNNEKFELNVDVPGVKEEDIEIKLEENMLTVQGQRMAASETSKFSSKFSKTFSLDQTVDVEKFTASLKNGVLTVSAPKDLAKLEENIRRIPVMSAAAATVDDDVAEPALASGDTESDSQKMEHKDAEAEEASMDLDKE